MSLSNAMQLTSWQPASSGSSVACYSSLWYSFPKLSFPAALCRQLFEAQLLGSLQKHGLNEAREKSNEVVSEGEQSIQLLTSVFAIMYHLGYGLARSNK